MTTACRSLYANARVYDADIGRFLSADTLIPSPYHSQSYNRYSYLNNNPLGDTDSTGNAPDGQTAEEFLREVSSSNGLTETDGEITHTYTKSGHVNADGSKTFDISSISTNESGDKFKVSVHGSIAVDGTTTMAATLSMIKDGSKVSYGTVNATFSPIGNGKASNGAKSASFANLFDSLKSITKTLAYEAFAMTPVGGIYDTLEQYNAGQIGGLMAVAMLGMNFVPGGAVVKRLTSKIVSRVGARFGRKYTKTLLSNPRKIWGSSVPEISEQIKKEGYDTAIRSSTRGSQKATIISLKRHPNITQIQVHPGGGRHVGAYYKISTSQNGTIKVVDRNTYKSIGSERATIIYK